MIARVRGIESRCDNQNQVAFTDHLDYFNAAFNLSFYPEAKWFEREYRESFSRADCECILILIERGMCDDFVALQLRLNVRKRRFTVAFYMVRLMHGIVCFIHHETIYFLF